MINILEQDTDGTTAKVSQVAVEALTPSVIYSIGIINFNREIFRYKALSTILYGTSGKRDSLYLSCMYLPATCSSIQSRSMGYIFYAICLVHRMD